MEYGSKNYRLLRILVLLRGYGNRVMRIFGLKREDGEH
jgi:hypothetical protein